MAQRMSSGAHNATVAILRSSDGEMGFVGRGATGADEQGMGRFALPTHGLLNPSAAFRQRVFGYVCKWLVPKKWNRVRKLVNKHQNS